MAMWISTTETAASTDSFMSTPVDLRTELQKLGQASTSMDGIWNPLSVDPYPARLRLLTPTDELTKATKGVWISAVNFHAFDTTYCVSGVAGTGQHLATVQEIVASQSTPKNAYGQSRITNGTIGGWQPNWFRPRLLIDGVNVFPELESNGWRSSNGADLGLGLPLPYCWEPYTPYPVRDVRAVEVWAPCAQYVAATGRYQRYPVQCTIEFLWA